jgi:hypothetical protein
MPPVGRCGDVNADQDVDVGDAMLVAQFAAGLRRCGDSSFVRPDMCDVAPEEPDSRCDRTDALAMAMCDLEPGACALSCVPFTCPLAASSVPASAAQSAARAARAHLVVSSTRPNPGASVEVELFVDAGGAPLGAYRVELEGDRELVQILEASGGTSRAFASPPHVSFAGSRLRLAAYQASGMYAPSGAVSVARVRLRVLETVAPDTRVELRLLAEVIYATDGRRMASTAEGARLVIDTACPASCDDGDRCTADWCDPTRGCVHEDRPAVDADGVSCSIANVRSALRERDRTLERRLVRLERLIAKASAARRPRRCQSRVRAALRLSRAIEGALVRRAEPGVLISPQSARLLADEGARLSGRANTLAAALCERLASAPAVPTAPGHAPTR